MATHPIPRPSQIGGFTIHSACSLSTGGFPRHRLPPVSALTSRLAKVDVVVIDEVSMVSASLLAAIDSALVYARTQSTGVA